MKTLTRTILIADKPTANGNIYPEAVLRKAVEDAQERVKDRRMLGNGDGKFPLVVAEVTHVITDLRMEGGSMVASIEFLDTPMGKLAQDTLDAVGKDPGMVGARVLLTPTGKGTTEAGVVKAYELESVTVEWGRHEREVREENDELNHLFGMQRRRIKEATKRWQEATGRFLTHPDLGDLVQWLLDGRDAVEKENAALEGQLTVVRENALKVMHLYPQGSPESQAMSALFASAATTSRNPSVLFEETKKLKAAVREHARQLGDDRCWLDDEQLYAAAGIDIDETQTALPPKEEFLGNCARYHESRQKPGHKYVTVEERVGAAREALKMLYAYAVGSVRFVWGRPDLKTAMEAAGKALEQLGVTEHRKSL